MTTVAAGLALLGAPAADGNGCVLWRLPPPARWALDAKRPRFVYRFNRNPLLLLLNALPDRLQCAVIRRILRTPGK